MSSRSGRRSRLRSTLCRTAALTSASAILLPVASAAAAPAQPTGFHLRGISPIRVALSWNLQADAVRYEVLRNGTLVGTANRSTNVATPNQTAGTTASWSVRAVAANGSKSAATPTVTATTPTTSSLTQLTACVPGSVLPAANYMLATNITMTDPSRPCFQFQAGSSLNGNGKTITVADGRPRTLEDGAIYGSHEPVIRFATGSKLFLQDLRVTTKDGPAVQVGSGTTDGTPSVTDVVISNSIFANRAADPNLATGQDYGAQAISVTNAQSTIVSANTFTNTTVSMTDVEDASFAPNGGKLGANYRYYSGAATLTLTRASHVIVGNNDLNGGGTGQFDHKGSDDNILIFGMSSDLVVSDNTLGFAYDAGIEFVGMIARGYFERNTIRSVGFTAIGEWYRLYVMDSFFRDNKVSNAPSMIHFRTGDHFDEDRWRDIAPDNDYAFTSNTIEGNSLTTPTTWSGSLQPPVCVNTAQFTSTSAWWLPQQAEIFAWYTVIRNNTAPATGPSMRVYPAGILHPTVASTGNTPSLISTEPTC